MRVWALALILAAGCGRREHGDDDDDDDVAGDGDADADADADGDGDGDTDADGDADGDGPCVESAQWEHAVIAPADPDARPIQVSIAVDDSGVAHVAWIDRGALWYASDAQGWEGESVTAEGGIGDTAIAIDAVGGPTIAYLAADARDLVVARREPGWSSERVDEEGNVGWAPAIAFGPDGDGHVVYGSTEEGLKHAVLGGLVEVVDADAEGSAGGTIAIAQDGTIHVLGRDGDGRLRVGSSGGDGWERSSIATEWSALEGAITVDGAGVLHLAAVEQEEPHVLHSLRRVDGTWQDMVVDPQGAQYVVAVVDADDAVHVVYHWYDGGDLRHARAIGNDWTVETIASAGSVGQYPAAAIGPDGMLHVAYRSFEDGSVRHASRPAAGEVGPSPVCSPDPSEE